MQEINVQPTTFSVGTLPEVLQRLSVVTALKKDISESYQTLRIEAETLLLQAQAILGVDRAEMRIGDTPVGKASLVTPKRPRVTNEYAYGSFAEASEINGHPAASRTYTITVHDCDDVQAECIEQYIEGLVGHAIDVDWKFNIDREWEESLSPVNGQMVTPDGETVPGVVPPTPQIRVTGVKSEPVRRAIVQSGLDIPVSGLLGGE